MNELMQEQEVTHDDTCSFKATLNGVKHDVSQYEENGILLDIYPLTIE